MAKFCGNCGAQLEKDATKCNKCGQTINVKSTATPKINGTDHQKPTKVKKILKSAFILAIVVIVLIIAFNIISNFTGYKGLIRKIMKAYKNYDLDTLVSISSDMYYYGDEDSEEYYFEDAVSSTLDWFEVAVGHDYKLTYKINETYTMPERKLNEVIEEINQDFPDFDESIIKEIVVASITITAKQDEATTSEDVDIIMTKEGRKWKLLYIE